MSLQTISGQPFRYAMYCAVSTREQMKPDKFSLADQEKRCRDIATERGWVESAGPFIVKGQSREKYIQLYQAEKEIPEMRHMLAAARAKQFDCLVMTETDRMRGLLEQIFRTLAQYGIQLFFTNMPIDPMPPERYSIYNADQVLILIKMAQTASSLEISRTRRKYMENMPKRITDLGLPAGNIRFGYRKPAGQQYNRKAVPEPDPLIAPHIIAVKDLHLLGHSTSELIDYLEDHQIRPPKGGQWTGQVVRDMLRSPFYAGIVEFGKSRVYVDPLTDTRKRNRKVPKEQIKQNTGKHVPLWDLETHKAILQEYKRRSKQYRGRVNNQFTGLVKCGVCGASMWRQGNGPRGPYRMIWRCSTTKSAVGHCNIPHEVLIKKIGDDLASLDLNNITAQEEEVNNYDLQKLEELETQLTRLRDAYLAGKWDLNDFDRRKRDLEEKIAAQVDEMQGRQNIVEERLSWETSLGELAKIKNIPHWLATNNPGETNRQLHTILKEIVVTPDRVGLKFKFGSSG